MVVNSNGTNSNMCPDSDCSTNDCISHQGVGDGNKKREQTESYEATSNTFRTSVSTSTLAASQHLPCPTTNFQQQQIRNESNCSTMDRVKQERLKHNGNEQQLHQHHPNCCLNLRESCVDSPCISIQPQLGSSTLISQNDNNILSSGVIASSNTATVVTIGSNGTTGFKAHSKRIVVDSGLKAPATALSTFKNSKSNQ